MNKRIATMATVAAIGFAGLVGSGVNAQVNSDDTQQGIISALAEKFNADESEVKSVFDDQREARQAQRNQMVEEKLAALVEEGKLTQEQSDKLKQKREELKAEAEANRPDKRPSELTDDEREAHREKRKAMRAELKSWLEENEISEEYARFLKGGGHHRHGGER